MLMPSVLIIEDDEDGRRAVSKLFAQADWKVFEAADGDVVADQGADHGLSWIILAGMDSAIIGPAR